MRTGIDHSIYLATWQGQYSDQTTAQKGESYVESIHSVYDNNQLSLRSASYRRCAVLCWTMSELACFICSRSLQLELER